ncbi:MAG: AAA family ATPase [Candidatus Acidiferrum sp.]
MTLEAILARFEKVQRSGADWKALCPAHEDKNPSLSITEKDGKILVHCHAGCTTEAICTAAGFPVKALFARNGDAGKREPLGPVVATYEYQDENGQPLYKITRHQPKTFLQHRADGNGGWISGSGCMNGVRLVPYHLPQLLAAPKDVIVFVPEGEKDVESLEALGLVATTNPMGAGKDKWKEEFSEFLCGRPAVVIRDNDSPGKDGKRPGTEHAIEVGTSLHLRTTSTKIIEMPNGKKDFTAWVEWMGDSLTAPELKRMVLALAEDAPEWKPTDAAEEKKAEAENWRELFHTLAEFENSDPLTFAIDEIWQNNGATLIGGLSGHGKTLLMLSITKALLLGEGHLLWGRFPVKETATRVIYLIPESTKEAFWHRLCAFKLQEHVASDRLLVRTLSKGPMVPLSDSRILTAAKDAHVFLDTAVRFSTEGDENSAGDNQRGLATDIFALLGAGARSVGGAHHSPKPFVRENVLRLENVLRGSGDIGAMISTAWGIKQLDAAQNVIHIENIKPRDFQPPEPFQLIGRPYIDQTGDFVMHKDPGKCGYLMDEQQPDRSRGGAPESEKKQERIGMVSRWLDDEAGLNNHELIKRFKDEGIDVSYATVKRYRKECGRSN